MERVNTNVVIAKSFLQQLLINYKPLQEKVCRNIKLHCNITEYIEINVRKSKTNQSEINNINIEVK